MSVSEWVFTAGARTYPQECILFSRVSAGYAKGSYYIQVCMKKDLNSLTNKEVCRANIDNQTSYEQNMQLGSTWHAMI